MNALSPAASDFYDLINAAVSPDQLANLGRALWHQWGKGDFDDEDATFLSEAIEKRKPQHRSAAMKAIGALKGRISRFAPRQRPRSPDRKASRDRRRTLGSSSSMPPDLRALFTEGQRAVLAIVCGEVKHHGTCDLPNEKIAALAGVCRTTVQTTVHEARRLGLIHVAERPRPGQKNLTNLIRIMSREWLTWLKRGPTAHRPPVANKGVAHLKHTPGGVSETGDQDTGQPSLDGSIGSNSVKMVSATKNTDLRREEAIQENRSTGPSDRARLARRRTPAKGNPVTLSGSCKQAGRAHDAHCI
jgi:hypothetical protein